MKKFIFLFAASSMMLLSCSKDKDIQPDPPAITKKLVTMTYNSGDGVSLSYLPDGRIHKINEKNGNELYEKTFSYSPGKVSYIGMLGSKKSEVGEYTIENGRATSFTWTYFDAYEMPIKTFQEIFVYNAKGQLEKHIFDNDVYTLFVYNDAGDISDQYYYKSGVAEVRWSFTYYAEEDKFPWMHEDDDSGERFFHPALSKHLRKTYKKFDLVNNTLVFETISTYELDEAGYAKKANISSATPGISYVINNIFQ